MVIGVTGGVGSGKSTVLSYLESRYHAMIFPMDDIGRQVMEPGQAGFEQIVATFGPSILQEDGKINRQLLAERAFTREEELDLLNKIVHPLVREQAESFIAEHQGQLVVLESAILAEAGYLPLCDQVWYVYASPRTRQMRLMLNRGYGQERIQRMMQRQYSEEEFRVIAQVVLVNEGTPQEVWAQIDQAMENWEQSANH